MVRLSSRLGVLLSLAVLPLSSALKFDLQAHTGHSTKYERCIRNFVAKDTLVLVTAIVSGQKGDGQMVNMHVPHHHWYACPALSPQLVTEFCNLATVMNPTRHVELDIDIGADARDWSAIQAQEKLKPVETELRRVEELVAEIVTEMDYLRTREQKLRDTNESTNERVKWFAFGTMGMLVGLGAWQVVYLRAYFSLLTGNMVTVIIGGKRKSYVVHRDLLCYRSNHFKKALLGEFKEAQTGQIEFLNEEEQTFEMFLGWLYNNNEDPVLRTPENYRELQDLIDLLCFARCILLEELSNECVDLVRRFYANKDTGDWAEYPVVSSQDIDIMYNVKPVGKKLRFCRCLEAALLIHSYRSLDTINTGEIGELVQNGGEFAFDFSKLLVFLFDKRSISCGDTMLGIHDCIFHDHHDTAPCSFEVPLAFQAKDEEIRDALALLEQARNTAISLLDEQLGCTADNISQPPSHQLQLSRWNFHYEIFTTFRLQPHQGLDALHSTLWISTYLQVETISHPCFSTSPRWRQDLNFD
ncbi:MAG: hypothetical protein Q9181_004235 [Wetmoreana brouardii]